MGYYRSGQPTRSTEVDRRKILRVAWLYAIFSIAWIVVSDLLIYRNHENTLEGALISIAKGLIFVGITTVLIYLYIFRALKNTQSERDALRKRLQEWSKHANDMILLYDEKGRVLEANDRAIASYGYSTEEFTQVTSFDLVAPNSGGQQRWQAALDKGESRARIMARRKDGSYFPAEYNARRIDTADGILIQSIIRDMTESEVAQQQIIRLKDLYAALSQTNHCITLTANKDELFQTTCEIAVRYGHFKMAWIGLCNEQSRMLEPHAHAGDSSGYLENLQVSIDPQSPLSQGPSGRAVRIGEPVFSQQIPTSELAPWSDRWEALGIASTAAFPLFRGGKPVGALSLYSEIPDFFRQDLNDLLVEMAHDISSALDRMEMEAERSRLAAELVKSHAWVAGILNGSSDLIATINLDRVLTLNNAAYSELAREFGFQTQIGSEIDKHQAALCAGWQKALHGESVSCEWTATSAARTVHFESLFGPLRDQHHKVMGAFHVGRDITRHKAMQLELRKLMTAIEQSPATVVITDREGTIQYVNPAFCTTTGYTADEVIGGNPRILKSGELTAADYSSMWEQLLQGQAWEGTFHNKRKDGSLYWEEAVIAPVRDPDGTITQFIAIKQDVTLRREAEDNARFLAFHDPLTRLPNRLVGKTRMEQAITEASSNQRKAALMFLDVDHFKRINDSLGHHIGDHLLQALVERLRSCIRGADTLSRHGGDEFLIVLANVSDENAINHVAERIREQTSTPFHVDGFELSSTVSIGVAVYPDDGASFDELHRYADLAMYCAKKAGRNTFQMYTPAMNTEAHEYLLILNGLRKAIDRQEFVLHYQPQIDLRTGKVTGAEALLRWQHPDLGLIPPGRFISVAEDSGLIVEIGNWVIQESCREARRWRDAGHQGLVVAANISTLQFRRGSLEEVVSAALQAAGIEPCQLELELTESAFVDDQAKAAETLKRLHKIGVGLALDDFGTGYSSFSYLSNFTLDKLKIDQSFVRNISVNRHDESIVASVVQLARDFGLRTVAEGVESEEALGVVRRAGCDQAQGYYFASPMEAVNFAAYLQKNSKD